MMRTAFVVLFTFFMITLKGFSEVIPKTYEAIATSLDIKIDGKLNDEAWKKANSAGDFIQLEPVEAASVTQRTEVRVLYDNTAIYVFARLFDSRPDSILHELGNRDEGLNLNADGFRFAFDPYNKRQSGYVFIVTASVVQTELLDDDLTFYVGWQGRAVIDNEGWTVEMNIRCVAICFP